MINIYINKAHNLHTALVQQDIIIMEFHNKWSEKGTFLKVPFSLHYFSTAILSSDALAILQTVVLN